MVKESIFEMGVKQIALLSQVGSVIAFFAMTRGMVPQTKCFRMHS